MDEPGAVDNIRRVGRLVSGPGSMVSSSGMVFSWFAPPRTKYYIWKRK